MSRHNAPANAAGPPGGQWQHGAEQDPAGRRVPQAPQGRRPQQAPLPPFDPLPPHSDQGRYGNAPAAMDFRHAQGSAQPRGLQGGYADPAYAPQHAGPGYARPSPFPPPQPAQPLPYADAYPNEPAGGNYGYAQDGAPQGGYPQAPYDDGFGQQGQQRGYAQGYGAQQGGHDQWAAQGGDPRGYDLSSFAGPGGRAPVQPSGRGEFGLRAPAQEPQDWSQGQGGDGYGYRQDDGYGYRDGGQAYGGYAGQETGGHPHGSEPEVGYDDQPEEPEVDEGRSGRRGLMIVGALVGAIALGGGLAYAYKQFGGGKGNTRPPIVKAEKAPAKTRPVEQGGKEFAHADKKLMERLDESRPGAAGGLPLAQTERLPEKDENGALKVRTIPVGRDGAMAPPSPVAQGPQQQAPAIPGLVLDGSLSPRGSAPAAPEPKLDSRPALPAATAASTAQRPVIANKVAAAAADPSKQEPAARAPVPSKSAARKTAARDDAAAPAAAAQQASAPVAPPAVKPSAVGAGGYVAIVASQKSRMEALKAFADLQQKYGGVLQGKTPDVQEANLGAKGHWFRAVVGPPGSREAAGAVCTQLKSAGYTGCWVGAY